MRIACKIEAYDLRCIRSILAWPLEFSGDSQRRRWRRFCPGHTLCLFAPAEELRYCSHCRDIGVRATYRSSRWRERKRDEGEGRKGDAWRRSEMLAWYIPIRYVRFSRSSSFPFPLDVVTANCLPIKSRRLSTRGKRVAAFLSPYQVARSRLRRQI